MPMEAWAAGVLNFLAILSPVVIWMAFTLRLQGHLKAPVVRILAFVCCLYVGLGFIYLGISQAAVLAFTVELACATIVFRKEKPWMERPGEAAPP
jgi:hypothetical protein